MKCIIVDDEPHAIDILKGHLERIPSVELIATFRNPIKAATFINDNAVDLVILDVNMPNLTGKELLGTLSRKPMVIFATAYSEYAVDSYEYDAIDYLVKPILFERFLKAIHKAQEQFRLRSHLLSNNTPPLSSNLKVVYLKSGVQLYRVLTAEILFAEKDANYVKVHTTDRKILMRGNFSDLLSILPNNQFVQIHKSFVISVDHIDLIENHQVIVKGIKIPIGTTYREDFLKAIEQK